MHAEKTDRVEAQFDLDPVIEKTITGDFKKHMILLLFMVAFVDGIQARKIVSKLLHCAGLLAFIGRCTIGNAHLYGLAADLRFDGTKLNGMAPRLLLETETLADEILSCTGGVLCSAHLVDVVLGGIYRKVPCSYYLAPPIMCWSVVRTFLDFTKPFDGLIATRPRLGLPERGFLGEVVVHPKKLCRRHTDLVPFLPQNPLIHRMLVDYRRIRYD